MLTLLVDNYDSYTYNLYDLISRVNGREPLVVRADTPLDEVVELMAERGVQNVVISPGPGSPTVPADIGCVLELLKIARVPVLGVCLGHQALAYLYGARVASAAQVRHGYVGSVEVSEAGLADPLWKGIPKNFKAVRYHSLAVYDLPACLP